MLSSFSCPNYEIQRDYCLKLRTDCVPGRPGCALSRNSVFAVPVEERIRLKEEAKRRQQGNKSADDLIADLRQALDGRDIVD